MDGKYKLIKCSIWEKISVDTCSQRRYKKIKLVGLYRFLDELYGKRGKMPFRTALALQFHIFFLGNCFLLSLMGFNIIFESFFSGLDSETYFLILYFLSSNISKKWMQEVRRQQSTWYVAREPYIVTSIIMQILGFWMKVSSFMFKLHIFGFARNVCKFKVLRRTLITPSWWKKRNSLYSLNNNECSIHFSICSWDSC